MTLSAKHRSAVPPALRSPYSGTTTARGKPAVNNSYPDFYISTATQALLGRMNRVINSSPCRRADSNSLCSSATDTPAALVQQSCLQHLQQPRGRFLLFWEAGRRMPAGSSCSVTNQGGGFSPEKEPCVTPACANPPTRGRDQAQAALLSQRQRPPGRAGAGSFQPASLGDVAACTPYPGHR